MSLCGNICDRKIAIMTTEIERTGEIVFKNDRDSGKSNQVLFKYLSKDAKIIINLAFVRGAILAVDPNRLQKVGLLRDEAVTVC